MFCRIKKFPFLSGGRDGGGSTHRLYGDNIRTALVFWCALVRMPLASAGYEEPIYNPMNRVGAVGWVEVGGRGKA